MKLFQVLPRNNAFICDVRFCEILYNLRPSLRASSELSIFRSGKAQIQEHNLDNLCYCNVFVAPGRRVRISSRHLFTIAFYLHLNSNFYMKGHKIELKSAQLISRFFHHILFHDLTAD